MTVLIQAIEKLKNSEISEVISERINEFSLYRNEDISEIFKELCFCIMTANCGAEKCIEIHELIDEGFLKLNEQDLVKKFKEYGYRFPNVRSNYIIHSRTLKNKLKSKLLEKIPENEVREWIVKNIKGLGYKESSHFLRNIGYKNLAIIDFHIVDILTKHGYIEKPKTMTKRKYIELEAILKDLAKEVNLTLAELDLYLWYLETGKILK